VWGEYLFSIVFEEKLTYVQSCGKRERPYRIRETNTSQSCIIELKTFTFPADRFIIPYMANHTRVILLLG